MSYDAHGRIDLSITFSKHTERTVGPILTFAPYIAELELDIARGFMNREPAEGADDTPLG